MVERHSVILGLSRQARFLGLPLPYMLAVGALTMYPFIFTKMLAWLLTAPLWYVFARIAVALNPNGHRALAVVLRKTPPAMTRRARRAGRHYV